MLAKSRDISDLSAVQVPLVFKAFMTHGVHRLTSTLQSGYDVIDK